MYIYRHALLLSIIINVALFVRVKWLELKARKYARTNLGHIANFTQKSFVGMICGGGSVFSNDVDDVQFNELRKQQNFVINCLIATMFISFEWLVFLEIFR